MQTAQAITDVTNLHGKITGYELQTALLRGGLAKLGLNPLASLTLLYLASCYNGKAVYPKIKTIAENIGASESGVKKALVELVNNGCILKAKRHHGNNANIYTLANKVLSTVILGTNQSTENVLSCKKSNKKKSNKEHHQEKQNIKSDDDFNSNSSFKRHIIIDEVPLHLRTKRNPCGYWATLNAEEKKQQLEIAKELERKKLVSLEKIRLKKEAEQQAQQEKQRLKEECNKPLNEQFTYDTARNYIIKLAQTNKKLAYGVLSKKLAETFNINVEELLQQLD